MSPRESGVPVVTEIDLPSDSILHTTLVSADFHDAYKAPLSNGRLTPTEIFLLTVHATPPWVNHLMSIRNLVVRQIGLKDVGTIGGAANKPADTYQIGDRLGIFTIFGKAENELVLGINDRHLDVRVSVLKSLGDRPMSYVVSTVVKVHNWLGHIYMAPVGRIHPLVVKAVMRRTVV